VTTSVPAGRAPLDGCRGGHAKKASDRSEASFMPGEIRELMKLEMAT